MVDMKALSQQIEVYVEVEDAALVALVNFCYLGVIEVNHTNVLNILSGACLLQLSDVQDLCSEFLEKEMCTSNCLKIRSFAEKYPFKSFIRFAASILGNCLFRLWFAYCLPLKAFFSGAGIHQSKFHDELNVRSEEQVFAAVIEWVKFDLTTRKQFLFKLLEHVRLPICHPKFLVDTISKSELVKSDAGCRDLVDEAKVGNILGNAIARFDYVCLLFRDYQLLDFCMIERLSLPEYRVRPRKVFCGEILYAGGGWTDGRPNTSVERFDPAEANAAWQQVPPLSKKRDGLVVLDHMLYAIGGCDNGTYWDTNER
ncbi:kelch repeat protein, partial [Cooperia oncophora]